MTERILLMNIFTIGADSNKGADSQLIFTFFNNVRYKVFLSSYSTLEQEIHMYFLTNPELNQDI